MWNAFIIFYANKCLCINVTKFYEFLDKGVVPGAKSGQKIIFLLNWDSMNKSNN